MAFIYVWYFQSKLQKLFYHENSQTKVLYLFQKLEQLEKGENKGNGDVCIKKYVVKKY